MIWAESLGRIELDVPTEAMLDIARQGNNEPAVVRWLPAVADQIGQHDPALVADVLAESGGWDREQLHSDYENAKRLLWLAAWDLAEEGGDVPA